MLLDGKNLRYAIDTIKREMEKIEEIEQRCGDPNNSNYCCYDLTYMNSSDMLGYSTAMDSLTQALRILGFYQKNAEEDNKWRYI